MANATAHDCMDLSSNNTFLPTGAEDNHRRTAWRSAIIFGLVLILTFKVYFKLCDGVKTPYVGYRSVFEPAWLVRLRFSRGARPMINEGYQKFKNSMFKVSRNDRDLLVVANKYIDELRNLPNEKLSSIQALIVNIVGKYSASTIMLESNLPTRILQTKLTPNLANFTDAMKDELDYSLKTDFPECEDWTRVQIYQVILKVIARISNRVFVSEPICRNEEWIKIGLGYSDSVTLTVMILRCFPPVLHPLVAMFLPSAWKVQSNLRNAKKFLTPVINARREAEQNQPGYQKPTDVLQWMMDAADETERPPDKLAHRLMILVLGSVHTTTMTASHAMYDMCAIPEYFAPLRAEILDVLKHEARWQKDTLSKMLKLDSFLKESQRISPASLLGFHRIVQTPITLSDGTHLPTGTHLCVASAAAATDPANFPDRPTSFHGFRYFDKRQSSLGEANKHQFAMTDRNHLHFGYGKHACPGRFFASYELKMVLAELLLKYEFRYPEGKGRPENLNADEFLYADPYTVLEMKKIEKVE